VISEDLGGNLRSLSLLHKKLDRDTHCKVLLNLLLIKVLLKEKESINTTKERWVDSGQMAQKT
jgi:hypothetical protein